MLATEYFMTTEYSNRRIPWDFLREYVYSDEDIRKFRNGTKESKIEKFQTKDFWGKLILNENLSALISDHIEALTADDLFNTTVAVH
jgi:hypothetical protein